MFVKLVGIYTGAHFFSAIGGAYAMEQSLSAAAYEPLTQAGDGPGQSPAPTMGAPAMQQHMYSPQPAGGYFPPGAPVGNPGLPTQRPRPQMGASTELDPREVDDGTL